MKMVWVRTALEYQGFYTLTILALAVSYAVIPCDPMVLLVWGAVGARHCLFRGSLYCLVLLHLKVCVYMTPIGVVCFLIG